MRVHVRTTLSARHDTIRRDGGEGPHGGWKLVLGSCPRPVTHQYWVEAHLNTLLYSWPWRVSATTGMCSWCRKLHDRGEMF